MTTYKLATRGRYVEAEVNRNLLFWGAPNANSRTIKVTIKNIDDIPHTYTVMAATSMIGWDFTTGQDVIFTHVTVNLNPNEAREVWLDIANGSTTPPNPNASHTFPAVNIYVDNATSPDAVIWPIWVLDITADSVAHVIYDKATKYVITGSAKRYIRGLRTTLDTPFFIADIGGEDYLPASADKGVIIAISPLDRTAGVLDITSITSQGPGNYRIPLNPITTGYVKVTTDVVVDYSKLGSFLGSAMAWITSLGADVVEVFLNNGFIRQAFLASIDPFLAHYLGAQNITVDAYVDPKDRTKVHILFNTYYNVNDDPLGYVVLGIVIAVAFMVGAVSISWAVVNVSRAEVQKEQIRATREMNQQVYKIMTDPNLSDAVKELAAKYYGAAAASISQLSGVPACDGLAVGNTCISWWVFAAAAGLMLVLAISK